jgi:hypothetical protein
MLLDKKIKLAAGRKVDLSADRKILKKSQKISKKISKH